MATKYYDLESRIRFLERELRQAERTARDGNKSPENRQGAVAYREAVMVSLRRHYKIQSKLRHDRHPRRKRRSYRVTPTGNEDKCA